MPRLDKTGPEGKGPKTGRGLGDCNKTTSDDMPGRWWRGRFGRRGAGRNWGFRNRRNDIHED
ncbi:MAG: DUF5320 domain-containing protein [Bacteroidales bacterium]|nr:DUF5320 domain-containing protein [Bacteroidales bacterium]